MDQVRTNGNVSFVCAVLDCFWNQPEVFIVRAFADASVESDCRIHECFMFAMIHFASELLRKNSEAAEEDFGGCEVRR